jgi:hypothetical protein
MKPRDQGVRQNRTDTLFPSRQVPENTFYESKCTLKLPLVSHELNVQMIKRRTLKRLLNRDQKYFDNVIYKLNRSNYAQIVVCSSVHLALALDTYLQNWTWENFVVGQFLVFSQRHEDI